MATSSTREGSAAMIEESNEQSLAAKPLGWLASIRQFWHDVALEMKRVSWPSIQPDVVNTTVVVIVAVFFFAFYLFAADIVFTYAIKGLEWVARKIFG